MTLNQYKKAIDKLVKDGHGGKDVFYAIDDEGNDFRPVSYSPSVDDGIAMTNNNKARVIIN
jgi:hypothetical protein